MLEKWLLPDIVLKKTEDLDIANLRQRGIRLIILDVDNTLAGYDQSLPDERAKSFVRALKKQGLKVVLISNNTRKRIAPFASALQCEYCSFALKPWGYSYRKVMKQHNVSKKETAVLGDQLFTDGLGGKHLGLLTIITAPLQKRDIHYTRLSRQAEALVWRHWRKHGKVKEE